MHFLFGIVLFPLGIAFFLLGIIRFFLGVFLLPGFTVDTHIVVLIVVRFCPNFRTLREISSQILVGIIVLAQINILVFFRRLFKVKFFGGILLVVRCIVL